MDRPLDQALVGPAQYGWVWILDIVRDFLEKWERDSLRELELLEWIARFRADKWKAAHEFWQAMYDGMAEAFAEGLPEPPHAKHGPVR